MGSVTSFACGCIHGIAWESLWCAARYFNQNQECESCAGSRWKFILQNITWHQKRVWKLGLLQVFCRLLLLLRGWQFILVRLWNLVLLKGVLRTARWQLAQQQAKYLLHFTSLSDFISLLLLSVCPLLCDSCSHCITSSALCRNQLQPKSPVNSTYQAERFPWWSEAWIHYLWSEWHPFNCSREKLVCCRPAASNCEIQEKKKTSWPQTERGKRWFNTHGEHTADSKFPENPLHGK